MAYLDGSPSPGDGAPEQINAISIEVNEPEVMIASLLLAIYRITGRRIDEALIDWVDLTKAESSAVDQRPDSVRIGSIMTGEFTEDGYSLG